MRLIDTDDLEDVVLRLNKESRKITRNDYKALSNILFEFPTIDAVLVVRCKDCIWYNKDINQCRRQVCAVMYADDFCSYGERRDEQEE